MTEKGTRRAKGRVVLTRGGAIKMKRSRQSSPPTDGFFQRLVFEVAHLAAGGKLFPAPLSIEGKVQLNSDGRCR